MLPPQYSKNKWFFDVQARRDESSFSFHSKLLNKYNVLEVSSQVLEMKMYATGLESSGGRGDDLSKNDSHEAACEDLLSVCLFCAESDQWSGTGNMANYGRPTYSR